jgi:peptide/nickel transport system substrate-binding protein
MTGTLLAAALHAATAMAVSAETVRWARDRDGPALDLLSQNEGPTTTLNRQIEEPLPIRDVAGAPEPALATS